MSEGRGTILQSTTNSAREICWGARDRYHACLEQTCEKSACMDLFAAYNDACPASWVRLILCVLAGERLAEVHLLWCYLLFAGKTFRIQKRI
jgi:hypothetical protein